MKSKNKDKVPARKPGRTVDAIKIVRSGHSVWQTPALTMARDTGLSIPTVYKARGGMGVSSVVIATMLRTYPHKFEELFNVVTADEIREAGVQYLVSAKASRADYAVLTGIIPADWREAIDAGLVPEENPYDPDGEPVLICRALGSDEPLLAHEEDGTLYLFANSRQNASVAYVIRQRWGLDIGDIPPRVSVLSDKVAAKYKEKVDDDG